jgi:phospholipase C
MRELRQTQIVVLTRSRDNLPNPISANGNPYVPLNMPAIGGLFDMFDFGSADERRDK